MVEYFDEVDWQDRPTGRKITKIEAHEQNLLHRCAAVFVAAPDGRLYIQAHKKSGLMDVTVGGHVTAGENYLPAALREADEEVGMRGVQFIELATSFFSPEYNMQHMFGVYMCDAPTDWRFVPNDEVDELYLMDVSELVVRMNRRPREFTPGLLNIMPLYLAGKKIPHQLTVSGKYWK